MIVDLEGQFNAPVAVTLDSLQIAASLAGRPMASVVGLMRRVRGEEAIRLLRETDLPLARIAERVGYTDASTLRTLVLTLSGQTPAALRRCGR